MTPSVWIDEKSTVRPAVFSVRLIACAPGPDFAISSRYRETTNRL
jgi:hypothetical protein